MLMTAASSAATPTMSVSRPARPSDARRSSHCPIHAVTPVASSASLSTKSDAMKSTIGSLKPPSASSSGSTPVAHSATGTNSATTTSGRRFVMKPTTASARIANVATSGSIMGPPLRTSSGCHNGPDDEAGGIVTPRVRCR